MVANESKPTMSDPGCYRVRVHGRIEPAWVRRIGEMPASEEIDPDGEIVTTLVGRLADQAALSGLLNTLYGLHLPVLSTEWLGEPEPEEVGDVPPE